MRRYKNTKKIFHICTYHDSPRLKVLPKNNIRGTFISYLTKPGFKKSNNPEWPP